MKILLLKNYIKIQFNKILEVNGKRTSCADHLLSIWSKEQKALRTSREFHSLVPFFDALRLRLGESAELHDRGGRENVRRHHRRRRRRRRPRCRCAEEDPVRVLHALGSKPSPVRGIRRGPRLWSPHGLVFPRSYFCFMLSAGKTSFDRKARCGSTWSYQLLRMIDIFLCKHYIFHGN